jgi:uncharacterized protein
MSTGMRRSPRARLRRQGSSTAQVQEPGAPRGRAWPAALLLIPGVLALGAGAGATVRYAQKTGLSAGTVLAVLVLLLGLALTGWAVVRLWRAVRGWWRLAFLPGALLAAAVAWSAAIAVVATFVPPTPELDARPEDHGLQMTEVELETADGVQLAAWEVPSANGAAVIVLHGSGSNRAATLAQAEVLAAHGYGLLLVDARGHGGSGGRGMEFGWYGDADLRAAVDHLAAGPGAEPARIGVLGLSMGGEAAIGAAVADPRIRAVVAEGATSRTAEDKAAWLPGGVAGAIQRGLDRMTYAFVDVLTPASPPIALRDAVRAAEATQFLLVTAGTVPDEARAAEVLQEAAPQRLEVWEVPDARHTGGLRADPAGWEQRVVGFFDEVLTGS